MDNMPPLPRALCRDDTVHEADYYTADQMHAYARDYAAQWHALYRRAINEANGLTNYVEDRPELRSAERRIVSIQADARAVFAAEQEHAK